MGKVWRREAWSIRMTAGLAGLAAAGMACNVWTAPLASTHLTQDNFSAVADEIVDLFDTRMLAIANLVMTPATSCAAVQRVSIGKPGLPVSHSFLAICPAGGSVTGTITDADADDTLSAGDRFAAAFHLCRISAAGEVFTGRSELEVARHTIDETVEWSEFLYRFDGLGTESLRWDGMARVIMREGRRSGGDQVVIDYLDLAVDHWAQSCRWGFRLDIWRSPLGVRTAKLDGEVVIGSLQLLVEQDEAFVYASGPSARAGRLTASAPYGNVLRIEGHEQGYRYSWRRQEDHRDPPLDR